MIEINENVQVVQDLYAAFDQGDLPGLINLLAEDVDWHFNGRSEDIPLAGHWRGHKQMMEFFSQVAATCEVFSFGPNEVIDCGEHVLALGHVHVQVKATGRQFETNSIHLFTLKDGLIIRVREFYDTAVMAHAFLPSESLPGKPQKSF